MDCRTYYAGVDPLWNELIVCPHCHYTNHYLKFFGVNQFEFEEVKKLLLNEHKPVVEARFEKRTDFDILVMRYLQAIHINEHINAGGNVLLGNLWRSLYWLSKDANDRDFAVYCARKAIEKFQAALEENQFFDAVERSVTALSLVNLMVFCNTWKNLLRYVNIALECSDERVTGHADRLKAQIERRENEQK